MKVIASSAHSKPQIFTVKSSRSAKNMRKHLRNQQYLVEILTEKEFSNKEDSDK